MCITYCKSKLELSSNVITVFVSACIHSVTLSLVVPAQARSASPLGAIETVHLASPSTWMA